MPLISDSYVRICFNLCFPIIDDTPLHQCVQHSLVVAVKELLAHGSDVNFLNRAGYSPLHSALQNPLSVEALEIVTALITLGYNTDINLKDAYGELTYLLGLYNLI